MKAWFLYAAFAVCLMTNFGSIPMPAKWFMTGLISCYILIEYCILPKFGKLAAACFAFFFVNSTIIFLWRENNYIHLSSWDKLGFYYFSADAFAKVAIIVAPIALVNLSRDRLVEIGVRCAAIYCIINAVNMIFLFFFSGNYCQADNSCEGVLGNPSMSACIMVNCLPFLLRFCDSIEQNDTSKKVIKWMSLIAVVSATLISRSSIAIGMLILIPVSYGLIWHGFKKSVPWIIGYSLIGLFVGWMVLGNSLFDSSNRFQSWKTFFEPWLTPEYMSMFRNNDSNWIMLRDYWHFISGTGTGTFANFSANVGIDGVNHPSFWWDMMHSDWLQILYENGFVGLALVVALFFKCLKNMYDSMEDDIFVGLILYGSCALFNYGVHVSVGAALGAWLVASSLLEYNKQGEYRWKRLMT